jgi:thiol-disulfide isomerase/thioredoxin
MEPFRGAWCLIAQSIAASPSPPTWRCAFCLLIEPHIAKVRIDLRSNNASRREHMRKQALLERILICTTLLAVMAGAVRSSAQDSPARPGQLLAAALSMGAPDQTHPPTRVTNPAAADAELPGAVYKEAMHPLDVVRQSLENWSDSELAALSIGIKMAHEACDKMRPEDYSKDDLYDLAHLCAFGQDWNPANAAAQRYIASKAPEHRAQAYAISVGAFVHINAIDLAVATTREMLHAEPYDAEVAYTIRYMKDYLEMAGSADALKLAEEEHAKIIDAVSKGTPLKATYGDAVVNTGLLFDMAMEAAFFERYAGNDVQATADLADVEHALPQNAALTGEDRQEIDSAKLQYHLLGTELAHIPVIRSFKSAMGKAQIGTNFGAATALVVFPDWCVQCRKMMPTMTQFGAANADTPIYAYGLIFKESGEDATPDAQKELIGTDVVEVSEETAHSFGTTDYPLGILVDHTGVIRFIGVLPSDAFNGDGYMERVITRMVGVQVRTLPGGPQGD